MNLTLCHLCDSLFPVGAFAYSDGLESATSDGGVSTVEDLGRWLEACLDESIGRCEGPAVWRAWPAAQVEDWSALDRLDAELIALRPSAAARRSTRAMGARLLATWGALHADPRLASAGERSFPIAFAVACVSSGVEHRDAVEAFAYTRLAATVSAAMRLMPIGQTDAHTLLARSLERVPAIVDAIAARGAPSQSFSPAMDIAAMRQQYLHSRLFRS